MPQQTGNGWEDFETYKCREVCFIGDEPIERQRSHWRCTLLGYPQARWRPGGAPAVYMGRLPVYDPQQAAQLRDPIHPEEGHQDGCPGGWYRNAFIDSLCKYMRLLTDSGYSSNVLLDRCDDPLVLEAMHYLEQEKILNRNHCSKEKYKPHGPRKKG